MPGAAGAVGAGYASSPQIRNGEQAAKAFEAMLFKQLMSTMSKSIQKSGLFQGGFEADLYSDMYGSAVAEQAAEQGIGLSAMIKEALGVEDRTSSGVKSTPGFLATRGLGAYRAQTSGPTEPPVNRSLAAMADQWLAGEASSRWSPSGELTRADLASDYVTEEAGGLAAFNVKDASGYKGYPKCNLFAFEMVRRSGHMTPIRARGRGWGYPGADATAKLAERGDTREWANVRTSMSATEMNAVAASGAPLLLASSAEGSAVGHMAVADRVHSIRRDQSGNIMTIEYSGWDVGKRGASYGRKVWRLEGVSGEGRGNLNRIQVLEPRAIATGSNPYVPLGGGRPGPSLHDGVMNGLRRAQGSL